MFNNIAKEEKCSIKCAKSACNQWLRGKSSTVLICLFKVGLGATGQILIATSMIDDEAH